MGRWRSPPAFKVLGAAAVLLAGAIAACAPDNGGIGSVVRAISGDRYALDADAEAGVERFETVFLELSSDDSEAAAEHFVDAFKRVRAQYVTAVDDTALIDSAVAGMTEAATEPDSVASDLLVEAALDRMLEDLDPHSVYLTPQEYRESTIATRGEFGGLGIEITADPKGVKVVSPIEDTPAQRAGMQPEDIIVAVDGVSIEGASLLDAVRRMRGKPGTEVVLSVIRGGRAPMDVAMVRDIIVVRAVRWRSEGTVGYVRVTRFTEQVEAGISKAVTALHAEIGPAMSGLVLDLRSNPGGLLDQSALLADAFLESGDIVSVRGRDSRRDRLYRASRGDLAGGLPMVVLINGGSASASEIVAGALQDNGRAVVMGRRSFGKGSVQTIMPLPAEGAVKLTTQLYYVPSGRAIQAYGIEPDIILDAEEDPEAQPRTREADLPGAIAGDDAGDGRIHRRMAEAACPAVGDPEDRMLGCALDLLSLGTVEKFIARYATQEARRP
jgi:carboxyl-terminal processing protease